MLNLSFKPPVALAFVLGTVVAIGTLPAQALDAQTQRRAEVASSVKQAEQPESPDAVNVEPVTDQELTQFANVLQELQAIQNNYRDQVLTAVQTEGLSPERFDQILATVRSPQSPEAQNVPEVSNEEAESFQRILAQIGAIQETTRSQMQQAILDEGLQLERFQEIAMAVNSDQSLEQRVRQMIEGAAPDQS